MKPARFSYEAAVTLEAALVSLAARRDDAKVIAGGQSLAPMLNMRLTRPGHLIDINGLAELAQVQRDGESLVVGALVRHAALARNDLVRRHVPMLAHAAATIGHYAIRQRGTIGGSLAHADPAAQLPLVALALDGEVMLRSMAGTRSMPARNFFVSIFTTAMEPDELLIAVRIPIPDAHEGWGFRLFARRSGDFAIVSVSAMLAIAADGAITRMRLAVGGIGPVPVRAEALAGDIGGTPSHDMFARIGARVAAAVEIDGSEGVPAAYRRELVAALIPAALADAVERAR
jgi:CO/xanthine dehydrogenase FAD-binding subunit